MAVAAEPYYAPSVGPHDNPLEWPEYRAYVRKIPCVICQIMNGKVNPEDVDYEPEIVDVSDPNHVKTRGAGGVDAENLVPLCRQEHHPEFHTIGITRFELKYNVSLKAIAQHIFGRYLHHTRASDQSQYAFARHQQLVSRFHGIKLSGLALGELLIEFRDARVDGKHQWEYLGFESFKHYVTAPLASGGLDMSQRSAYRCMYFAEASAYSQEGASVEELGSSKAQTILPMLKAAQSGDEQREIIETAQALSHANLISWRHQREGRADPRIAMEHAVMDSIVVFMKGYRLEVEESDACALAREIIALVTERRVVQ